ncbi:DUF2986 domain-containing protein [Grimontia kaedaensis]|uniref:DUF2986 domain-containing protein n=2 Tax=Grimontia TaxID=246861 RepID=A0A128F7J8_9GAMM|nr:MULTISPECIES: DUF2986 domain-containing protein [Grimontia]USH04514.1 DUF2986 domain-containing protein [Grimontia kaedaensis]CZF82757.1 hypothetical protein GCE9029_03417 [Grimontia celer]
MNRKKKIIQTLKKKDKKQKAKMHKSSKPRYISKAEREKMAQQEEVQTEAGESAQTDNEE